MTTMRRFTLKPDSRMAEVYEAMPRGEWVTRKQIQQRLPSWGENASEVARITDSLVARGLVERREFEPGTRLWHYLKLSPDHAIMQPTQPPVFGPPERGIQSTTTMAAAEQGGTEAFTYLMKNLFPAQKPFRPWLGGAPVGHTIAEHDAGVAEGSHHTTIATEITHGTARCYMVNGCREAQCVKAYTEIAAQLGIQEVGGV